MEARNFVKVRLNRVSVFLTCHVSIDSVCDNLYCLCYMTMQLELCHFCFSSYCDIVMKISSVTFHNKNGFYTNFFYRK
jgi:hypothetical protein